MHHLDATPAIADFLGVRMSFGPVAVAAASREFPAMSKPSAIVPAEIVARILNVRGQRVLLDADLAAAYGVTTARLNQQVNRNLDRFPSDFIFHLTDQEVGVLMLQIATSKPRAGGRGGTRKPPRMFYRAWSDHGRDRAQ